MDRAFSDVVIREDHEEDFIGELEEGRRGGVHRRCAGGAVGMLGDAFMRLASRET